MPAPIIEKFSGPINAITISQWLQDCEDAIQKHVDENLGGDGTKLGDDKRISYTGASIAVTRDTVALANWWKSNMKKLEKLTWNEFRDRLKTQALGPTWKMKALQSFVQLHQGTDSIEDYISKLDDASLVIERADGLSDITEDHFKCQLLFNSSPKIIAQVTKLGAPWFKDATVDAVKDEIRKYGEDATQSENRSLVPVQSPSKLPDRMWVLSGTWGGAPSTAFNDLNYTNFPQAASGLGRVSRIILYDNNNASGRYLFQGYNFTFVGGELGTSAHSTGSTSTSRDIYLDPGEYPIEVTFWRSQYTRTAVSGMQIKSTKGRTVQVGTTTQDIETIRAPPDYRLVGFYGTCMYDSSYAMYYYDRIGVIFASIGTQV